MKKIPAQARSVRAVIDSTHTFEGAGFPVTRPFPTETLMDFDPFLLLDEMGPMKLAAGQDTGAPDHPHRGFETVTYLLEGEMEHRDSQGNIGHLKPGDVQWMTAGAGVIHSELTPTEFTKKGGTLHGVQLWVNLASKDKMTKPRYQDIAATRIPVVNRSDGLVEVKVIAGESLGAKAVIETHTPIIYLDLTIQPGGRITQPIPVGFNTFAYIIAGEGQFGEEHQVGIASQMVLFESNVTEIVITNPASSTQPLNLLLIGGKPLGEKVTRYGPFVMNSESEIHQAIADYRTGKFGNINI